jgi:hypothetical protein
LPAGGVIVQVDARTINSDEDLKAAIQAARAGQEVELSYYDSSDRFYKKFVRLGEIPATGTAMAPGSGGFAAPGTAPPAETNPRSGLSGRGRPLINMAENLGRNAGLIPTGPTGPSTVYDPLAMAALQHLTRARRDYSLAVLFCANSAYQRRKIVGSIFRSASACSGGRDDPASPRDRSTSTSVSANPFWATITGMCRTITSLVGSSGLPPT